MTLTIPESMRSDERYDAGEFDGVIQELGKAGDTRIMWDRRNKDEVAVAAAAFKAARDRGSMVYKAEGKDGHQGEQVKEFDKKHERLIVVPQLVGG